MTRLALSLLRYSSQSVMSQVTKKGRVLEYLLSFDMRTNEEDGLHENNGGTQINAHDFSSVDFTVKKKKKQMLNVECYTLFSAFFTTGLGILPIVEHAMLII